MIALEVTVNGKRVCTAGSEDLSVLSTVVTACGRLGKKTFPARANEIYDVFYRVGGLTSRADPANDIHLNWQKLTPLAIGDIIQIKILETTRVDRPKSRTKAKRPNLKRAHRK